MKNTRNRLNSVILLLTLSLSSFAAPALAETIFAPALLLQRNVGAKTDPAAIADTHLGIAYREDGALDGQGRFTTFDRPDVIHRTPGLNCSGLVLSVSRFLFRKNFTLDQAARDRQGNSGEGSPLGKDWDFGLDLILNITDGAHRRAVMPDGKEYSVENADGSVLRGFDLADVGAWQNGLNQMRPGRGYFGTISKPSNKPGYRILHYHVVLIIPDSRGGVWLYHATKRSSAHRMNLATPEGMGRFLAQFSNARRVPKKILVVEAVLPKPGVGTITVADSASAGQAQATTSPERLDDAAKRALQILETVNSKSSEQSERSVAAAAPAGESAPSRTQAAALPPQANPGHAQNLVINHLAGKVFKSDPDLATHIPYFADDSKSSVRFWFSNRGKAPRDLEVVIRGPGGDLSYRGSLPPAGKDFALIYPRDFGKSSPVKLQKGKYGVNVRVDGVDWLGDLFEIAEARDAKPVIARVKVPASVRAGSTFNVEVVAANQGAESDYGGITVSCPEQSGLSLVSAKPGRVYPRGSTVLAVTSDKIRTKVPMAERWIELWAENKPYDMTVTIRATHPGTYPVYVRCALRSVSPKSSVILMDPASADAVDQQGFPVKVYSVTVQ